MDNTFIKVVQVNLQRSEQATLELTSLMRGQELDLALVQGQHRGSAGNFVQRKENSMAGIVFKDRRVWQRHKGTGGEAEWVALEEYLKSTDSYRRAMREAKEHYSRELAEAGNPLEDRL